MKSTLLFAICCLAFSFSSKACDCFTFNPPESESYSIFDGRVLSVEEVGHAIQIKIQATKVYKGIKRLQTFIVWESCTYDACCGIDFKVGECYLVRTRRIEDEEWTDYCLGTKKLKTENTDSK